MNKKKVNGHARKFQFRSKHFYTVKKSTNRFTNPFKQESTYFFHFMDFLF